MLFHKKIAHFIDELQPELSLSMRTANLTLFYQATVKTLQPFTTK